MKRNRHFIPEIESVMLEKTIVLCNKPENHDLYKSPNLLCDDDLPYNWKRSNMVDYLKCASRRVVHLTVLQQSPSRLHRDPKPKPFYGSGCLTFHPVHGAIVHTSKHVVFDPFEAERTVVRLFYDDENTPEIGQAIEEFNNRILAELDGKENDKSPRENVVISMKNQASNMQGLFLSKGNNRHFQSVMCSDYTSFSCDLPIHELFSKKEIDELSKSFSQFNFTVKKLSLSSLNEIDVSIISHPHGHHKKISFGRMSRLCNVSPALYDAATCGGSSGAPLIRLNEDTGHIHMGMFVHHGHNKDVLNMGMGTVRPPWTFPYIQCMDTENTLTNAIDILYEPVFYWTLFFCDLLHLESTFINVKDVFAYTSTLSALLGTMECLLFRLLFTFYWLHTLLKFTIDMCRTGLYYAVCGVISSFISMLMFNAAWLVLYFCPLGRGYSEGIAIVVWLSILYIERYFRLASRFQMRTVGSFTEVVQLMLLHERGVKAKTSKKSSGLVTTSF